MSRGDEHDAQGSGAVPVAPKGPPGVDERETLSREWTALTPEEECRVLESLLARARDAGDAREIERIEARLRLLHAR